MRTSAADPHERRLEPRHTSVLRLGLLMVSGEAQLCRVTNISPQGVQATVFRPVPAGARVLLRIPDGVSVRGNVVWTDACRIGLKFDEALPEGQLLRLRDNSIMAARRRLPPAV